MATSLTGEERARIRHHLGYPSVGTQASIALGVPSLDQSAFLVELNVQQLLPEAVSVVLATLAQCETCERELVEARKNLSASAVDNVTLNPEEMKRRHEEYVFWCKRLAADIGAPINPYAPHFREGASRGISIPVAPA